MKLKIQKKTAKAGEAKANTKKTAKAGNVIGRTNFDNGILYVGARVPTMAIQTQAKGTELTSLNDEGYLVLRGDKPGTLVFPVKHNGDVYARTTSSGATVYGSVKAVNAKSGKTVTAELTDLKGLLALAKKENHAVNIKRVSDGSTHRVALLNSMGDQYFAGIAVQGKKLVPVNMEHVERWNSKGVQFTDAKDMPFKEIAPALKAA